MHNACRLGGMRDKGCEGMVWTAERLTAGCIDALARDVGSPLTGPQAMLRIASIVFPPVTPATQCRGGSQPQSRLWNEGAVHKNGTFCDLIMRTWSHYDLWQQTAIVM